MTKEEIVQALRVCGNEEGCPRCPYFNVAEWKFRCNEKDTDAADLIEAQAAEIEKLEAQVPRWIPVEERLPETAGSYIVCTKSGSVVKVNFYPELGRVQRIFTHWMPLPGVEV